MTRHTMMVLAVLAAGPAAAQDADWTYRASIYGWFPGMTTTLDTRFGPVESSSSASDALSNLDMVFMGSFAAQRGRLGFLGDLLYVDLSDDKDTPLAFFGDGTVGVKTTALSGYVLYRVTTDPKVKFDVGAGFRAFDVDIELTLSPGVAAGTSETIGGSWTDPLLAARLEVPINDDWFLMGFADWGGTGGGDETWQVYGAVGYQFNENWAAQFGYRYMDISKEIDGRDVSVDLGGPVLAMTYRF